MHRLTGVLATLGGLLAFSTLVFGQDSLNVSRLAQIYRSSNPNYGNDVALTDIRAYLCAGYAGIGLVDISDPDTLLDRGDFCIFCNAQGMAIDSSYGYIARTSPYPFVIADLHNPNTLTRLGSCNIGGSGENVAMYDHYAMVAAGAGGLRVVNVSNPDSITEVGSCTTVGNTHGVAVGGTYAYTAGNSGFKVLDLTNPTTPILVDSLPAIGYARNVVVRDTLAFVVGVNFNIVNIANPTQPVVIGTCALPDTGWDVALFQNAAYIADDIAGVRILDIENLTDPRETGFYNSPGHAYGVAANENHVYLADGNYFGLYEAQLDPLLRLTGLNGGETVVAGTSQPITWSAVCVVGDVNIQLNRNYPDGEWEPIFIGAANDGNADWAVTGPHSHHCRIRVVSANDTTVGDTSDANFAINRGTVVLHPHLLAFGDVAPGTTVTDHFYLRNTGADTLTIDSILTGDPIFTSLNDWHSPIAPGDSLAMGVVFAPSTEIGYFSQFILYTSAGDSSIDCSGRGVIPNGTGPLSDLPTEQRLYPAYPNPFNAVATIAYDLPAATHVSLRIFDALGRTVNVLEDRMVEAGNHHLMIDGSDLASGVYFARLETGRSVQTSKLVLLK